MLNKIMSLSSFLNRAIGPHNSQSKATKLVNCLPSKNELVLQNDLVLCSSFIHVGI